MNSDDELLIERVVDELNAHNVTYVLIGGAAMVLHGSSYITVDVDVCYARDHPNIDRLVQSLAPFSPSLRLASGETVPFLWDARTVANGMNFTMTTTLGDVDLLGFVTGLGAYESLREYAKVYRVGEREVPMLTPEGLILTKRAANRPKDLLVLPELEMIREKRDREGG